MPGKMEIEFRAAAMAHGAATAAGDSDATNRAFDEEMAALRKMRALPDKGKSILTALLADLDPSVRSHAATGLLPLDPTAAIPVLEEVAQMPVPFVRLDAEMVLKEWRAGRLNLI